MAEKKKKPTERQVYDLHAAGNEVAAWKASLDRLPDGAISQGKYELWKSILNDPYCILDTPQEALDFLGYAVRVLQTRYYHRIGDERQNGTLYIAAVNVRASILRASR